MINALLAPGQWQSLAITALLIVVGLTVLYVALRRSEAPVFTSPLAKRAEANGRHLAELRHANRAGQARPQTEKKLHNLLGTLVIGFVIIAAIIGVVWVFREPTQILSADINVKSGPVFHVSGESPIEAYIYVQNDGKSDADIVRWRFGIAVVDAALGDRVTEYAELGSMELEKGTPFLPPKDYRQVIRKGQTLLANDVQLIRAGGKRIYVYGVVSYLDGNGELQETRFCHTYSGSNIAAAPSSNSTKYLPIYNSPLTKSSLDEVGMV